ncbi:putative cyclin-D6-1 isoform X1 [Actinidia eriantha]|uniref:putative cyclin-D6-1 isoform X1 n=1 Tax=Actinidia eriantha TaxID=165200 RepID=UPI002584E3E4|nr:putative cyclin-D6-1 isoform X1 [Actinidia eriantha]
MEFELENPLTSFEEHQFDTIPALFANESDHMPSHYFSHGLKSNDFRISVRREAISLIFKAQFYCNFDSIIPCLAISYVDRFISMQEIWNEGSSWITRLLAISCLSLAAKMKNTGLSISDLQRDEGFVCDSKSIRRMELLILTTLNWKMRSITPFSFFYFFISLFDLEDPPLIQGLRDRASEILFRSHYEIKILEYKPSIIAASALLCASQELFPLQFPCFRAAIASCEYVNKEKLLNCSILMEEMGMDRYKSTFHSVCNSTTPISVLDRLCTETTPSCDSDRTVKISQYQQCNDAQL